MKSCAVAVIGHVDHGKTSLVRALTGIETDRLKEEKERGMSIALGFAHRGYPSGNIDFIDVPGHEDFVRTMVAGATGAGAAPCGTMMRVCSRTPSRMGIITSRRS